MNWKVGDRAILVSVVGDSKYPELYGEQCELICFLGRVPRMARAWSCKFASKTIKVNEFCLRPIPDDKHKRFHKALVAGKWSDCEYNPMVTVESAHDANN